jgi:hypothetical protein
VGGLIWALVFSYVFFREIDHRGIAVFLILLAISEVFLRIRWRMKILCPHCGFDPILYQKSPERAAEKVRVFLEERKNNPNFLLAPRLNLPQGASLTKGLKRATSQVRVLPNEILGDNSNL